VHAEKFQRDTLNVDMTPLYDRFLPHLPESGHILDAGCGPGRDGRAFLERGFRITAFDASSVMAKLAEKHIGQPVEVMRFQDIEWTNRFDGVWACTSLLHVPRAELPDVLCRLTRTLKSGGVLFASFKYGCGERVDQGRHFTDLDEDALALLLDQTDDFQTIETWTSCDLRPGRESNRWLNTLLRSR